MLENSVFFIGDVVFTKLGEPIMTNFLNEYRLPLRGVHTPFLGQTGVADFTLDYRHTESPIVTQGQMDSKFFGEILYKDHICQLEAEPFDFLEGDLEVNNGSNSQVVMTDSAFTCAINSLAKSPLGHFDFNQDRLNKFFDLRVNQFKFDSTGLAEHMPIFERKLGKNKPLKMTISFSHIKSFFGKFDTDVVLDYVMNISFKTDKVGGKEVLYDQIRMVTSANIKTDNDLMFIDILNHKLDVKVNNDRKKEPIRNNMKLTTIEYREFLSTFQFTNKWMMKYIQNHIKDGIRFPWKPEEFLTNVKF